MGDRVERGRRRRVLDVAAAAMAALLAFGAVPVALVVAVGNPLSGDSGTPGLPAPGRPCVRSP